MPKEISITGVKAQFSRIVKRVAAGEEIIVTKHGKPSARLRRLTAAERAHLAEEKPPKQ